MITLSEFWQSKANKIDQKIYELYEEFKKFICCSNLPNFIIQYVDSREDNTIFFRALVTVFNEPIILFFNIDGLDEESEEFQSDLIHEFTHLYDYSIQKQYYDNEFIRNNFSMYSEHHACQIETLWRCKLISHINDDIKYNNIDKETLLKLVYMKIAMYTVLYNQYKNNPCKQNFIMLKKSYLYVSGAVSLFQKITKTKMIQMPNFLTKYQDDMKKGIELLWSVDYSDIPSEKILNEIGKINIKTI